VDPGKEGSRRGTATGRRRREAPARAPGGEGDPPPPDGAARAGTSRPASRPGPDDDRRPRPGLPAERAVPPWFQKLGPRGANPRRPGRIPGTNGGRPPPPRGRPFSTQLNERNIVPSSGISKSNRFSHLCYASEDISQSRTRVKLNRVFFPR